jgi:hypothetical protein
MTPWAGSTTPIDEMEEESLKILTEMFGSREEAISHYDEFVDKAKAADIIWAATQYQRDRKEAYFHLNQFELQYDDSLDGGTRWDDAIKKIKTDHPKPD